MSESLNADGVQPADGHDKIVIDNNKPQLVKFETYDKAMATLAKEKAARVELEQKLQAIQEKEMLDQGKYQELLQQKELELKEMKEQTLKEKASKIEANVRARVTEVATHLGAYDASDVLKNLSVKELGIDADGNVDVTIVKQKVEEIRAKKAYLFKQSAARVADGAPMLGVNQKPANKMSIEEMQKQYLEIAMRNK